MLPFRPVRAVSAGRAFALALSAALTAALLLPAGTAHAADSRTVSGGRLDWGIKSSFQSYVTGPIAHGSWTLQGGAATVGGSAFRFHSAKGSYVPDSGDFEAGFSGGVRFTGHKKPDGSNELDLTISRPTVRISGGKGTLYADMVSKAKGSGRVTTASQVPLAALNLSGVNMRGGGTAVALANIPATLTAQGAQAFAGYYTAGTALDPVNLSADVRPGAADPSPSATPSGDAAEDKDKEHEKDAPKGEFTDAAVDWGVRRTFREYVTGPIAQGKWQLGDGAQDGGALFRFPKGKGSYDEDKGALDASFAGTLRFTGAHLDLSFRDVEVAVRDGKGTLSAGVSDGKSEHESVPLATFEAKSLKPKDGLIAIAEAPAKLTAEGAKAFGSMYQEGADMDPVSLSVALDAKAKLPPLPDLGHAPSATPKAADASSTPAAAASSSDSSDSSSSSAVPIAAGAGALVVLIAAGTAFTVVRKRRAAAAAGAGAEDGTPPAKD
ncbi:HtaA domain-containing protein [Streptomyces sp. NPDC050610]|uniref:HtaA domain-containing protein n=1 Tax=Streptomyces sp. NPDC050610 TaxID=3157097 RepID=UPI00343AFEDA